MDWDFLIKDRDALTITTDSRKITPGCVFVALKGEHFDGNDYVEQAEKDGAVYIIKGDRALEELQDLARSWRRKFDIPVIAITGTNGKTTTKELTAAVLSTKYNVLYTDGNYNNSLGVPLTLMRLTKAHHIAIIEMGASHPGDIKELVDIAEPTAGIITNVGRAHLEGFGSFEGVMKTKGELYDYLVAHNGTIFQNADNPYLKQMLQTAKQSNIQQRSGLTSNSEAVLYPAGPMISDTHLIGDYNAENIQAALCIGAHFGISPKEAEAAVRAYVPTNNRSQAMTTERNDLVVDAYNANPTSMQAAIEAFSHNPSAIPRNRCYILGAMRELGSYAHLEHQNIVNMLLERRQDHVFLIGDEWRETTAPYPVFANVEELAKHLEQQPLTDCQILIKGSRSNQLEKIIPYL